MKIVHLTSGAGQDGAGRLALDIAIGLRQLGHEVHWVCEDHSVLAAEAEEQGIGVTVYPASASKTVKVEAIKKVSAGADIVNSHYSPDRKLALKARLHRSGTRLVFTRHALVRLAPGLGRFRYGSKVAGHIAVCRNVYDGIIRSGVPSQKTALIYGGVDSQRFFAQQKSVVADESLRSDKQLTIGIVGRFIASEGFKPGDPTRKGHAELFRAAAHLIKTTAMDCRVLIIGNGPDQEALIRQVAEHEGLPSDRIDFAGFVSPVAPYYQLCDTVVLPSDEGLALSLIEAMLTGVPVIGHRQGGTSEIVAHGRDGFSVDPSDTEEFANYLNECLTNQALRHYCRINNPAKAKLLFDTKRIVLQTEYFYRYWLKAKSSNYARMPAVTAKENVAEEEL